MAPFNKRQIGYIQAIAGRQQHTTLICKAVDGNISSSTDVLDRYKPQALDATRTFSASGGTTSATNLPAESKSLLLRNWALDTVFLNHDSRPDHNDDVMSIADLQNLSQTRGIGQIDFLEMFNAPVKGTYGINSATVPEDYSHTANTHFHEDVADGELAMNPKHIESIHRATPDGYLNSTHLQFRFTLPGTIGNDHGDQNPMGQDHFEFRWIVWRPKRPTFHWDAQDDDGSDVTNLEAIRNGCSFRNPGYDFFMGQTGRKRGLIGYTYHPKLDSDKMTSDQPTEKYSGARLTNGASGDWTDNDKDDVTNCSMWPSQERPLTVDDLLTMRINKDDYTVLKDVRFFLGKEHGKSHFEDTLHWDWNDPIDTPHANVLSSPTLNNKSYRWFMTLIGTSGNKTLCSMNYSVRGTTKMESG